MITTFKDYLKQYGTLTKRGLLLLNIFLMLVAIQTYVNYTTIIENTNIVQSQTQRVRDEISYFNNFQLKYLNSDHAKKLLAHEHNLLSPNEAVIAFKLADIQAQELLPATHLSQNSPREEWLLFFGEKLSSS